MEVDKPSLEAFRHEWIDELESARFAQLIGNYSHDRKRPEETREATWHHDREMSETSTTTLRHTRPSRESTATMRGFSETLNQQEYPAEEMDIDDPEASQLLTPRTKQCATIVVATDFGTTFSSVAYALREDNRRPRVKIVANFPEDPGTLQGRPSLQVPTESWYPDAAQLAERESEFDMTLDDEHHVDLYGVSDEEQEDDNNRQASFDGSETALSSHNRSSDSVVQDIYWGYGIQNLTAPDMDLKQFDRIARSKLILDSSDHTQMVRNELRPVIARLKRRRIIGRDVDVIADYLTQLFKHAKERIKDSLEDFDNTPVEHVLCVPIVWSSKALREMQLAMAQAIKNSGLGTMDNLFLVSEPEAAAAYVLGQSDEVEAGETFLILDAGGGTVDCTTYKVDKQYPLRLSKELVEPKGCLHGSSYLNEDFRNHLLERLKNETYLEQNGFTIEGIVDTELKTFENKTKRSLDVNDKNMPTEKIVIQGLRANEKKGFGTNRIFVTRIDFLRIFMPHLIAIVDLMRNQLSAANQAGHKVTKVVLIGGFSGSKSLRNYLKAQLKQYVRTCGYQIKLIDSVDTGAPETAVAHGAVLRALNKEHGPDRITNCSYGFLRAEPFGDWPEHAGVRPSIDKLDGDKYVKNTIEWLVKKGDEVPSHAEYKITACHIFPAGRKVIRCEEVLYVSDICTQSHYRASHPINKGRVEIAGRIIADMSSLVREGKIEEVIPDPGFGKPHYKIEFELVIIVDGRNLRYEARWPAGGSVRSSSQISIAAAFQPGTD